MSLTWRDARQIGELLFEKFGPLDPLTVRFTDLHKSVTELEDFDDENSDEVEKAVMRARDHKAIMETKYPARVVIYRPVLGVRAQAIGVFG